MNQGPAYDALKASDPNPSENYQALGLGQDQTSPYYAPTAPAHEAAPAATSWNDYWSNTYSTENGVGSVSGYNHIQPASLTSKTSGDGLNVTPVASTSSSGHVHAPQDYSGYASYSNTADPYGNAGYGGYYNNNSYQQQTTQSYQPQAPTTGAYQNSGAPYQPISSFQNSGSSYTATTNNSSTTYYNHADYQTSGSYQNGVFSNQTNYWPEGGQYASSYTPHHQYPNYPSEPAATVYNSTSSTPSSQYTQQYNKQWSDYYNQTQSEVTCAPGTENLSVPGASSQSCPPPVLGPGRGPDPNTAYQTMYNQPSVAYAPSWRPESNSSELPASNQPGTVNAGVHDGYWNSGASGFQNPIPSVQPHVQAPLQFHPTYENYQNHLKPISSQGFSALYPSSTQIAQTYQPALQPVPPIIDSHTVSKLQIPTNPRIASNLGSGVTKIDKDVTVNNIAAKPAYLSVSQPKANDKLSSDGASADSILKPGMFPKSLCGYVERSLARCKDDVQMAASQAVMKEIITKSTADGTLYTKDWDTEPLFSFPNTDTVKVGTQFSIPAFSLQKTKRSPNRRGKSRWEPLSEEKPEKSTVVTPVTPKFGGWNKQFTAFKSESKVDNLSDGKVSLTDEKSANKSIGRPAKRPRISNGPKDRDHGDNKSSDSDKEQSLASYYPAAVALSDSPEEKRRREHRSKRFDKGNGNRAENKHHFKPKFFKTGSSYHDRRASASALVLSSSRNIEDSVTSVAVEDIDWDALTVKGTCQDIEKRYLRLTSAPDPATVRPEEVLEKALLMVQNSGKNYLHKCDQLKSIRQDLTVQRIRNELTVKVYETHARLAIEVGDLAEYNQCQSQLQTLYAEGIEGCHMEFAAYNLLCAVLHSHNNRDLLSAMSRLSPAARKNDMVRHAFAVRGAVTSGNYVLFFRLYKSAPNLSMYLMDLYVEKMRYKAVKCMSRSHRPTVPVSYISDVLGFSDGSRSNNKNGTEECIEWLKAHGSSLTEDETEELLFDSKLSMSSLYMPEPEDAVAHGDASLAVDDFLTRNPATAS